MKEIRDNPPDEISSFDELQQYLVLYDDISNAGVLLEYQDRHALAELALCMVDMRQLRKDLKENGDWIETQGDRNMVMKKNPARQALEKLQSNVFRLYVAFKITPNSRKLNITQSAAGSDELEGV